MHDIADVWVPSVAKMSVYIVNLQAWVEGQLVMPLEPALKEPPRGQSRERRGDDACLSVRREVVTHQVQT